VQPRNNSSRIGRLGRSPSRIMRTMRIIALGVHGDPLVSGDIYTSVSYPIRRARAKTRCGRKWRSDPLGVLRPDAAFFLSSAPATSAVDLRKEESGVKPTALHNCVALRPDAAFFGADERWGLSPPGAAADLLLTFPPNSIRRKAWLERLYMCGRRSRSR
jgi:hypothetical protein